MSLPELPVSLDALCMAAYLCSMSFTAEMVLRFQNLITAVVGFYVFAFSLGGFIGSTYYWMAS